MEWMGGVAGRVLPPATRRSTVGESQAARSSAVLAADRHSGDGVSSLDDEHAARPRATPPSRTSSSGGRCGDRHGSAPGPGTPQLDDRC